MPDYMITSPEGKKFKVTAPDGATHDQVLSYAKDKFGSQKSELTDNSSSLERFGSGLRDPLEGAAQSLSHAVPKSVEGAINSANNWLADKGIPLAKIPQGGMDEFEKQREQKIQQGRKSDNTDLSRTAGNIVSTLGLSALTPELGLGKLATVPKLVSRLGSAIAGGTTGSALQPVTEGDFAKEKTKQAEYGAGAGLVGGAATEGLARAFAPEFKGAVKKLLDEGVNLTPGQLFPKALKAGESALKSVPVIGGNLREGLTRSVESFNKAVFNRVLKPLGEKLPKSIEPGRASLLHAENVISKKYDDLLPKLTFKMDPKLVSDLDTIDKSADLLPKGQAEQIKNLWNHIVEPRIDKVTGTIPGKSFKKVESELAYQSRVAAKSPDPYVREMGKLIDEKRGVLRQALIRANPNHAGELSKIDHSYSMFVRARDASIRRSKAGEDPGLFTPGDLVNTIKSSNPKSVFSGGNATLQDLAEAGHMVIPDIIPNSGTTDRALWALLAGGSAHFNPYLAAAGLGASSLYTKPGMALVGALARPGTTREAIKKIIQSASPAVGTASGTVAGSNE